MEPGNLFVALRGDRFDGHQFLAQAARQGAIAAVVNADCQGVDAALPLIRVTDTLAAYQAIATWWRHHLATPLVAITGSVGKTTTKEIVAAALTTQGSVHKTQANYNNEIGVPKTLLELNATHHYGVIEMGMRATGEIATLARITDPNVAVITNVGTAHIGRLGSEQAIANAKCELLAELRADGIAVLNADNARLMATARTVWAGKQICFGLEAGDLQGTLLDDKTLLVDGVALPLPLPGRHNAYNLLAAIAVMQAFELDWQRLKAGLTVNMPPGRSRQISLPNDILLLDETYNAGVESMTAALNLLKTIPGTRRIAVLGTMKELGEQSIPLHRQVGEIARALKLDQMLILADPEEAAALAEGAAPLPSEQFTDAESLIARLVTLVEPGDRILFKASRAVALDRVVNNLAEQIEDRAQ